MNTTLLANYNAPQNHARTGSPLKMVGRFLAVTVALMLAQGSLLAASGPGVMGKDKSNDKNLCEICHAAKAVQTCKHCGKKICASCRAQSSGGKPICKKCAGED
jgi:hypothetical protein